jgi:hypothetical protein
MPYDSLLDPYSGERPGLNSIGKKLIAVTPADGADLARYGRPTCLAAGNLTLWPATNADAEAFTFTGVPAGWVSPVLARRILATGTTGTWALVE